MNKRIIIVFIIAILILTGCNNKIQKQENLKESEEIINNMNIVINEKEYELNLENNETVTELLTKLPLQLNMNDLNKNEKYVYLDFSLKNNPVNPKHINKGDVMLFTDNCLVIFYKSFDTSYSYTKIGHINNLPDLDNNSISVKLEK